MWTIARATIGSGSEPFLGRAPVVKTDRGKIQRMALLQVVDTHPRLACRPHVGIASDHGSGRGGSRVGQFLAPSSLYSQGLPPASQFFSAICAEPIPVGIPRSVSRRLSAGVRTGPRPRRANRARIVSGFLFGTVHVLFFLLGRATPTFIRPPEVAHFPPANGYTRWAREVNEKKPRKARLEALMRRRLGSFRQSLPHRIQCSAQGSPICVKPGPLRQVCGPRES